MDGERHDHDLIDHKAFLSGLAPETREALTGKADGPGLRHLAGHAGVILGLAVLVALKVPFWPLLMLPLGIALAFLFTLEHECTHQTPFATPALNEWAGRGAGLAIGQPFIWFRYFHLAHHRFTNDPERDPELVGKPKPGTWRSYLLHVVSLKYWWGKVLLHRDNAFGTPKGDFLPTGAGPRLRREARVHVAIYAAAVVFSVVVTPVLLWVWLVPLLLGTPFLRLYLLAEHGLCPQVANMFDNTRTTFTNRVVRFLAWNMPYHTEHHVYPAVPFHKLPELHRHTEAHLRQVKPGYAAFTRDYAATLK